MIEQHNLIELGIQIEELKQEIERIKRRLAWLENNDKEQQNRNRQPHQTPAE